jgi:hypothetical protein
MAMQVRAAFRSSPSVCLGVFEADLIFNCYSIAGDLPAGGIVFLIHLPERARLLRQSRHVFPPNNMSELDRLCHRVQHYLPR